MKKEDFFEVLGELDGGLVTAAKSAGKENRSRKAAWVKWTAVAACFALILAWGIPRLIRSLPFSFSAPKGIYKIGTTWETDQFTFCVVNAAFCYEYQTEAGDMITPGDGCGFIAVEYNAAYAQNVTLSKCTLQKGDIYSEHHTAYTEPIQLTSKTMEEGNDYILLFSIPLSESDADAPSQNSYTLRVEIDTGEKTYARDFSLAQ